MLIFVVVGLCYAAGAELAWRIFGAADIGLAFFPPAGITLAAMVLVPRRRWWVVVAAIVVAEIAVDLEHGLPLGVAAGYALANSVEPLVGASLLLWLSKGQVELHRRMGVFRFLVAAVGAGAAAGAVIGGLTKWYDSDVAWVEAALHWWAGDGLGILTVATPILTWRGMLGLRGRGSVEAAAAAATVLVASVLAFWAWTYPPAILIVPVLGWVALRFGVAGVALASAVMAMVANVATAAGQGPFIALNGSAQTHLSITQLYLLSVTVTMWLLAIEGAERVEAGAQREAERAARVRAESANALGSLSELLMRQVTVEDVVEATATQISLRYDLSVMAVGLHDRDADRFRHIPAVLPENVLGAAADWNGATMAPGPVAMVTGASVWVSDTVELLHRFPALGPTAPGAQLHSLGALPLRMAGEGRGYVVVARDHHRPFSPDERDEFEAIAQVLGAAIERAGLYEAERAARLEAQLLTDQSPLLIWVHDANGEQEWVNQTFCEFFGVRREDMRSDGSQVLMHPEDAEEYAGAFASAVAQRSTFHARARVRRADGEWRWIQSWGQPRFDPAGTFLGHVGSSADLTERHQAEAELIAAHAFTQELTAIVPGVISVFDLDGGRNVFTSRQSFEMLEYTPEEISELGENFVPSLLHPDDAETFAVHLEAARKLGDNETLDVEYRFRHRDGSWRWFRTNSVPIRRSIGGDVTQIANLTIDVTNQRAHEVQLQQEAALKAYGARLADSLRDLDRVETIQLTATELLVQHLGAVHAQVLVIDHTGQYVSVLEGLVTANRQLSDYGGEILAAVRSGEQVAVQDVSSDGRLENAERQAIASINIGSAVLQPMLGQDKTNRLLLVSTPRPRAWNRHDLAAIAVTAERTSEAVQRAHTRRELARNQTRAALASELIAGLDTSSGLAESLQHIVDSLVPALADFAAVEQSAPERQLLASSPLAEISPRAQLTIPIELGDGRRGALLLAVCDPDAAPYNDDDLALFQDFVQRIEVVLAARSVRAAEHHIAVTLQHALLPDGIRWHPAAAIEARYRAASDLLDVGGDWYDSFSWPDGSIGVMVGDVVGHSLESAAAMGRLRAAAAALAAVGEPSPAALLDALDRFARSPDGISFATAACVVLQPETGLLAYASAGHPPPLLVLADGTVIYLDGAQSPPLTAVMAGPRSEVSLVIEGGSLVAMYSDGLIERRGESIDVGMARLGAALAERLDQPTAQLIDGIIEELTGASPPRDDIVLAAFRYTPAVAHCHLQAPAQSDQLAGLRQQMRAWLDQQHVTAECQQALLIAVGEACSNIVDHAYRPRPTLHHAQGDTTAEPRMEVDLTDHRHELIARISDCGFWRQPGPHSRDRGRGTILMQELTSRYERCTGALGTTVTLTVPAASRQQAAAG